MAQRILSKMAGIIRGKKLEPGGYSEGGNASLEAVLRGEETRTGQGASVSSSNGAFASEPAAQRPMDFEDHSSLSDVFRNEKETSELSAAHAQPQSANVFQSKTQQATAMSREISHTRNDHSAELIPADLIESVGRENEGLRHRCEEVVRKVEEAATLRQDLSAVFGHVDLILKDLERTKTALAQRTAALAAERDSGNDLRARHRQLIGDHEQLRGEHVSVVGERQKHINLAVESEAQISSLQEALAEKSRLFSESARRGDADRERLAQSDIDLRAAREEMQRADDLIFSLQSDLSAARDHATLVEEDNKTLQVNLNDARQQIARLARKDNEAHALLAAHKQRVDDLELMVNSERVEHGKTRGLWQSESTSRRSDVTALQGRLDAVTSRAEANDRLLAEARSLMHSKIEELRKAERRIQELQTASAPLESRLQTFEQENKALATRLAEIETHHKALTEHSEGLSKSVRARESDAGSWKQKLEALSDRFHIEMNRYEEERERFNQTISKLGEQLEKEKLDRAMAEGALEVARRQRQAQSSLGSAARAREAAGVFTPVHGSAQTNGASSAEKAVAPTAGGHGDADQPETRPRKFA